MEIELANVNKVTWNGKYQKPLKLPLVNVELS